MASMANGRSAPLANTHVHILRREILQRYKLGDLVFLRLPVAVVVVVVFAEEKSFCVCCRMCIHVKVVFAIHSFCRPYPYRSHRFFSSFSFFFRPLLLLPCICVYCLWMYVLWRHVRVHAVVTVKWFVVESHRLTYKWKKKRSPTQQWWRQQQHRQQSAEAKKKNEEKNGNVEDK